jgi:hypothetical protein
MVAAECLKVSSSAMQNLDVTGRGRFRRPGSFVLGLVSAHLRYRAGRAAALLGALLVAVTTRRR